MSLSNEITLFEGDAEPTVLHRFDASVPNKTTYIVEGSHDGATKRDVVVVGRKFPKRSGNFNGTEKVSLKMTKDVTVSGVDGSDIIAPLIVDLQVAMPVGIVDQEVLDQLARMGDAISIDGFSTLFTIQEI